MATFRTRFAVLKSDTDRNRRPYASVHCLKLDSFEALTAVTLKFPVSGDAKPYPRASSYRRFERILLPSPSWLSLDSSDRTISTSNKHTMDFEGLQKVLLGCNLPKYKWLLTGTWSWIKKWFLKLDMFTYLNAELKDPPRKASSICTCQPNINTRDIIATVFFPQRASLSPPHMLIMCLIRVSAYGFIIYKCRSICRYE